MKLTLSPSGIERFRESKQIQVGAQRLCKGPCKKRRSIAQFACDDELCITCRRRTPNSIDTKSEAQAVTAVRASEQSPSGVVNV